MALAAGGGAAPPCFDPDSLAGLPAPAARLLGRAIPEDSRLDGAAELTMVGEIALNGRWMPFRARQILRAGVGFVWAPVVGGGLMRFRGADVLGPEEALLGFRLWGLIRVARASGPDVRRSAAGRLAAETVAWLPQALTPQLGATWRPVDRRRAVVTLDAAGEAIDVEVAVDDSGALSELMLDRWDSSIDPPRARAFGGPIGAEYTAPNGVRIAGAGEAGWDWRSPDSEQPAFLRYSITGARSVAP